MGNKKKSKDLDTRKKSTEVTDKELASKEKHAAKTKHKEEKLLEEQLDYNRFPTIMGWFFDGFIARTFGLKEKWAIYFNDLQEDIEAIEEFENDETFTEKARRNFWPPTYNGSVFRTRGIYLDFKEVIKDPPRTPPEINFEHERSLIRVVEDHESDEDEPTGSKTTDVGKNDTSADGFSDDQVGGRRIRVQMADKDRYYFDDTAGEFLLRTDVIDCYFDNEVHVWRKFKGVRKTPYNYYFDSIEGKFKLRDRGRSDDYYWDGKDNIWKKKNQITGQQSQSKNKNKIEDFYFDEIDCIWIQCTGKETNVVDFPMGKRKVRKRGRLGTGKSPEEYFYNGEKCTMDLKNPDKLNDYEYDPFVNIWRNKIKPLRIHGTVGARACDFLWKDKSGIWEVREENEWIQTGPYHFYFDDSIGRYFPIQNMKRDEYHFDKKFSVIKKNGIKGPAANGLGPDDYFYDESKISWELIDSATPDDIIIVHPTILKRKICKGKRGKSGKGPDEFYYDTIEGNFKEKEKNHINDYYYDPIEQVWQKLGQPGGPGKSGLFPDEYYFDYIEGSWKAKSGNIKLEKHDEILLINSPYDWYFDDTDGEFLKRDSNKPTNYTYDVEYNVWKRKDGNSQALNGKNPKNYYFDEIEGAWLKIEGSTHRSEIKSYHNSGGRSIRLGPRGKNGKIPDDYYFDTGDEKFRLKDEAIDYEYKYNIGSWLFVESESALAKCKIKPDNYYFDDYEGIFLSKIENKVDTVFDSNARIWRKERHRPEHFEWHPEVHRWVIIEKLHKPIIEKQKPRKQTMGGAGVVRSVTIHAPKPIQSESIPKKSISLPKKGASIGFDEGKRTTSVVEKIKSKPEVQKYKVPGAAAAAGVKSWGDPDYKNSEKRLKYDQPRKTTF